jgi:hypothetical protein
VSTWSLDHIILYFISLFFRDKFVQFSSGLAIATILQLLKDANSCISHGNIPAIAGKREAFTRGEYSIEGTFKRGVLL